jgi:hypothetical protein
MNRYKIAEIAVEINEDSSNTFWISNAGWHPGQGGMDFCWGNCGVKDLNVSLDILKKKLNKDIDYIIEHIRLKNESNE